MVKPEDKDSKTKKSYWENIHQNKALTDSGWYQSIPESSLQLIAASKISKKARIIDVGGGDSLLVDHLLRFGYENITVLDISKQAIKKTKKRLGELAEKVHWICADITSFDSDATFDLWHDRACFHFLTNQQELKLYTQKAVQSISQDGAMIVGTFSKTGPSKCSGLPIKQYDASTLEKLVSGEFEIIENFNSVHMTPSNVKQNYVFCRFKRK
ncbi:MAG: class I SAM-dependent methyltransferase [Flavobacteriales bacterium]|nr:class I SAM-dependent methyltransferase [Flavobacteriales bacterium]